MFVSKLCVSKLCVRRRLEREEAEREEADGMQNQKQEPHTKMWGTIYTKFNRRKQVKGQERVKQKKIQHTTAGGIEEVKQVNI